MILTEEEARTKWNKGRLADGERYEDKYPIDKRFDDLSVAEPNSGCIIWLGALNDSGYGRVKIRSKFRRAHIVAWEQANGPVPDGLVIDHLCRVRCCINPLHMEVVTQGENVRRGVRDRKRGYCGLTSK